MRCACTHMERKKMRGRREERRKDVQVDTLPNVTSQRNIDRLPKAFARACFHLFIRRRSFRNESLIAPYLFSRVFNTRPSTLFPKLNPPEIELGIIVCFYLQLQDLVRFVLSRFLAAYLFFRHLFVAAFLMHISRIREIFNSCKWRASQIFEGRTLVCWFSRGILQQLIRLTSARAAFVGEITK